MTPSSSQPDSLASTPHDEVPPPTPGATSQLDTPKASGVAVKQPLDSKSSSTHSTVGINKPTAISGPTRPDDDDREEGEIDEETPPPDPSHGKPSESDSKKEEETHQGERVWKDAEGNITESSSAMKEAHDDEKPRAPPSNDTATGAGANASLSGKAEKPVDETKKRKIAATPTWDTEPTPRTPLNVRTIAPATADSLHAEAPHTSEAGDVEMDDDVILTPSKTLSPLRKLVNVDSANPSPLSADIILPSVPDGGEVNEAEKDKEGARTAMEVDTTPISTPTAAEEVHGSVKVVDEAVDDGEGDVPVTLGDSGNAIVEGGGGTTELALPDVPMDVPVVENSVVAHVDSSPVSEVKPDSVTEAPDMPIVSSPTPMEPPPSSSTPGPINEAALSPNAMSISSPHPDAEVGVSGAGEPAAERPLNVSDALSYLDAVKNQFVDKPNVYNRFLDIMKEFKGQMIDTPGVIRRVTHLFDGHPSLIQGFNTFLPAGYRIEYTFPSGGEQGETYNQDNRYNDEETSTGGGYLTVTTPNGVTRHRMGHLGSMNLNVGPEDLSALGLGRLREGERSGMLFGPGIGGGPGAATGLGGGIGLGGLGAPPGYEATMPNSGGRGPGGAPGIQSEAIEPAVQYVQKIKQQCDAETYKQFLDILGRYHTSPGRMDEQEVSVQIAQLFKDAPDLRSEFRIFMPPKTQQMLDDEGLYGGDTLGGDREVQGKRKPIEPAPSASSLPLKKKRRGGERERENLALSKPSNGNKVKHPPTSQYDQPTSSKYPGRMSPPPISRHSSHHIQPNALHLHNQPPALSSVRSTGPGAPLSASHSGYAHPHSVHSLSLDPSQFFARVKQSLDSRETYHEFLKVVNLFTQGYIDTARLVKEASTYLGEGGEGGEMLRVLKGIVGWDEKKEREMWMGDVSVNVVGVGMTGGGKGSGSVEWARPVVVERIGEGSKKPIPGRVDLSVQYGSYRKLPVSEVNSVCSGRDEMCRSVLNDEWVSHPTYASEDSGSPIFKKNVYEEALHRSEEERHEYDFHIDAISKMIALLEPINNKILSLPVEERHNFKLKPNLGGAAKSIHFRVVKKIYGRDTGLEVIQAMQDSPGLAIPIVFARLKQKEEEWKRAQREWNKVWREVDARNYQKSLDYQSTNFKANDKKALTTKSLVNQIEAAREEQMAKRASLIDPLFNRTRSRHQMEFIVDDAKVLQDVLKLVFSFLDRMQGQITFTERKRIESFLRSFVVLFFGLDAVAFNSAFVVIGDAGTNGTGDGASEGSDEVSSVVDEMEVASVTSGHSSRNGGGSSGGRSHRKGAGTAGDLRKKLLKNEQAKSSSRKSRGGQDGASTPSGSRLASPILADDEGRATTSSDGDAGRKNPRKGIFFANTAFYALLRLLEALYSRLALFKAATAKLVADPPATSLHNAVAKELGIDTNRGPPLPAAVEHYYDVLLDSCERLFDNEIEQHVFEDQMRAMFGTKIAFKIFTVDKVIGSIIKQAQTIFADTRSQELLENLKRDRAIPSPTTQDLISSRRNAEKVLGPDENLFRIDWLPDSRTITIQLLGKDDSSFDDSEVITGRWQAYLDSYVSTESTEGVALKKMRPPFLRRNLHLPSPEMPPPDIHAHGGLQIKVCTRTYRLFFVSHTEDALVRTRRKVDIADILPKLTATSNRRRKWLDSRES